ncbi:MAG: phosphoribosylformylglycinamidine synthase subunit PurQ [Candidatus Bathyarchaeota archaeon]|nr:phosphoribosylformylglycinamidine synthase subunit PurQ [Candidatus Bathyarchaeota archaeon]
MKKEKIRVCIMRVGGTNCDSETKRAFDDLGVKAEIVHLNEMVKKGNLLDYNALVFPGGFSYGDYVRAGAIWAKGTQAKLRYDLIRFVGEGRPVLGICNGFQVLVEAGLLPGFEGISEYPEAALATNVPIGYHCNWVYIKYENSGKCLFAQKIQKGKVLRIPVAHAEGRFLFPKEKADRYLKRLYDNDQLVFRYCDENGKHANGVYPINPNGAFHDIAGICDSTGTIFGLMPHPERAYYGWQLPDWTKEEKMPKHGDGRLVFESMIEYLRKKS